MLCCRFCLGRMRPSDSTGRVLVCESCGYFEVSKEQFGSWLLRTTRRPERPVLGPILDYPRRHHHPYIEI